MWFLPYEKLILKTHLGKEQVIQKVVEVVDTDIQLFRFTFLTKHKPYRGNINIDSFEIRRWISYRNSFLPIITGQITSNFGGSNIAITMRMNTFIIFFLFLWCGGVLAVLVLFFSLAVNGILQSGKFTFDPFYSLLLPGGMLLYGDSLTILGFKFESTRSKKFLQSLLEAYDVEELSPFQRDDLV